MFTRLPESNARRQRRTGGFVVSTVVHVALIALAVQATGLTAAMQPRQGVVDIPLYTPRRPAQPAPRERNFEARTSNASGPSVPAPPELPPAITDDIPTTLPEPGAMKVLLDHLFDATRVSMAGQSTGTPNVSDGSPLPENLVEKAVTAIPGTATPRYPSLLQSAGVQGNVRAQFVVDTLGQVEQGSFRVLEATHDLFTAAVRDALGRARFRPAEAGGRKVRQLVEQTFTFSITR
jgi:protein TonB